GGRPQREERGRGGAAPLIAVPRINFPRRSLNGSTEENTTGVLIQRKFPGTNKVVTRFMAMIPSVTGYRLATDLNEPLLIDLDGLNDLNDLNKIGSNSSKRSNRSRSCRRSKKIEVKRK